jgi:hypothetical protein
MCANCGHPTHIGRCGENAPNAQFRCHCVGVPLTIEQRIQQLEFAQANNNTVHAQIEERLQRLEREFDYSQDPLIRQGEE